MTHMTLTTLANIDQREPIGMSFKAVLAPLLLASTPPLALTAATLIMGETLPMIPAVGVLLFTALANAAVITKLVSDLRARRTESAALSQQLANTKKQGLRHSSWLKNLNEMSPDWYWETDQNFRFVVFEGKLAFDRGMVNEKMIGLSPWEIPALNLSKEDWTNHRATLNQHHAFQDFEICREGADGNSYWVSVSGRPMAGARSTFTGYAGICRVITDEKVAAQRIEHLALEDELTGLANRRLLLSRLPQAISVARRHKRSVGLLLVSLDRFKVINETHGNQIGDMVIREVASRLRSGVRASDLVARYNGDVFAVLLEEMVGDQETVDTDVAKLAEKLIKLVEAPFSFLSTDIVCSVCIGLTATTTPLQTAQQLISEVENALALGKMRGGGCAVAWLIRSSSAQQDPLSQAVPQATGEVLVNS